MKRGVVARGPRAIAGLGKNAAATGGGLRVNSRMQAPAGPLVVRARAVRAAPDTVVTRTRINARRA